LADTEAQSKVRESVKEKKVQKRYDEEFKRQAVELVIHSGKTQAQIARELGVSDTVLQSDAMEEGLSMAIEACAAR
jgi:transposase-like protein